MWVLIFPSPQHVAWVRALTKGTQIMRHFIQSIVSLSLVAILIGACAAPTTQNIPQPTQAQQASGQMANPASENCVKQGGTLSIEQRSDGGEYGVCVFEDNRQCEEWALLRGDCPTGGIEVTGYATSAARYCAITGGEYTITGNSNTANEQGTCSFKNGKTCDVWEYFNGKCSPNE